MKTLRRLFRRLMSWSTSTRDEELLRAEFEEHIAMQTAENLRAGLSPVEARRQALLKFGNVEAIKEIRTRTNHTSSTVNNEHDVRSRRMLGMA